MFLLDVVLLDAHQLVSSFNFLIHERSHGSIAVGVEFLIQNLGISPAQMFQVEAEPSIHVTALALRDTF